MCNKTTKMDERTLKTICVHAQRNAVVDGMVVKKRTNRYCRQLSGKKYLGGKLRENCPL